MSLGCGACRHTIFGAFGLMYRLVVDDGQFRYDTDGVYVPPNGAVCEACWRSASLSSFDETPALIIANAGGVIYAFQGADSMRGHFGQGGAAQWSSVEAHGPRLYFRGTDVERWSRNLVEVVDWDAQNKLANAREYNDLDNARLYGADPHNRARERAS